jgi:hypothetical protein
MCFSESQSYINTILLLLVGIYKIDNYRLAIPLFFLASKDLVQGLLYRYLDDVEANIFLTKISWVHICFQPFMVNLAFSNFSVKNIIFWNTILIISFIYGIFTLRTLHDFNKGTPYCKSKNVKDDFCSSRTMSYIGKYHVGYRFKRTNGEILFPLLYLIIMFVPALFTKSRTLSLLWFLSYIILQTLLQNIGDGERAAIWCFLSIICWIPLTLYEQNIKSIINKFESLSVSFLPPLF